ncbi:glycosyltransferase [Anaerolineales bacterium HSG25]|nr:glycosyltransferase [Anaerolineales bacterium HSG25]
MRIAIVTTHPPGQGSLNEYAFHFIRHLRTKLEVDELILLADELPEGQSYDFSNKTDLPLNAHGVTRATLAPVTVLPCWRFGAWNNPLRILNAVRQTKPDVVLFNLQFATFSNRKVPAALGLLTPALIKAIGVPTVVLLHNIIETINLQQSGFKTSPIMERLIRFSGNIITRFLLQADLLALTIPKYVEILSAKYKAKNLLLAPHGAFDELDEPDDLDTSIVSTQVMTFGKFGTYKRVETLIEAFKLLQGNGHKSLELVIAGSDSPNATGYLAEIQRRFHKVHNMRFTGYVPESDVPKIFNEAAVVVFPYTATTGSSGVLHQAGSYGKAVILPNLGDFAELITEEGYTGEFFEPDDPRSLSEAIKRVVDDPQRRRQIGMQNYAASRGIHISEIVDWYLLHIETLLKTGANQ